MTVTATASGNCVSPAVKTVNAGPFTQLQVTVSGAQTVCPGNWYTYTATVPGGYKSSYTYVWTKPANWTLQLQSQNTITYSIPSWTQPDQGLVTVSINNGCGFSSPASGITVGVGFCSFAVSPNPATNVLTIELTGTGPAASISATASNEEIEYSAELSTDSGEQVLHQSSKDGIIEFNTASLPRGYYILKINYNNDVVTKRILLN